MDIGSNNKGPAKRLSNFTARGFIIDGVRCASMEGFLQALKFENIDSQKITCGFVGFAAKKKGKGRNKRWQSLQKLWWNGVAYDRKSKEYQELLTKAYDALSKNPDFRRDLLATQNAVFTHSIGHNDPTKTVLTEREFCKQLTRLRTKLRNES